MNETRPQALAGVRVLDVGTVVAAPFCANLLAEFGAEVIKVEMPEQGDPARQLGMKAEDGTTYTWLNENRNKKCITLDLRKQEGKEILKRLVADSDIVVENFRPGTLERWGLDYETLKSVKSDLILVRISAYGQVGPYRNRPGFARLAHGFSGISDLTGEPDGPPLVPGAFALADYVAGLYAALGALLSYMVRQQHGLGQYVDISLYEGVLRTLGDLVPAYSRTGYIAKRMGTEISYVVPHNHYRAKDGKWVVLACTIDRMFVRLAEIMGQPELLEPDRYATMAQRLAGREDVNRIVGEWIGTMPRDEVVQRCLDVGIPAGPIYNMADIFEDEHCRARNTLLEVEDARLGKITIQDVFPRLSETPGKVSWLGADMGQHNTEIYRDRMGFTEAEIERLKKEGII